MADRNLTVHIIGDSRSLERAFTKSGRSATTFQGKVAGVNSQLGRLGIATGATIGLGVVFDQMRKATQAASNLNEQVNKSEVVFSDSAREINAWSQTTAGAFGISQRAAIEAAAGFGQILETAGLNQARAAQLSKSLVELSADMASFNDIDPAEALDKLRSGLAGEAEPLRRVGVLLSETRVQQEAYASGIAAVGSELTEQQKVLARYQLIVKDTKTAQGDFARTSESLANKQRILSASTEELQAKIGTKLVPVTSDFVEIALAGVDASGKLGSALDDLASHIPGGGILGKLSIGDVVGRLADDIRKLRGAKLTVPIEVEFDATKNLTKGLKKALAKKPGIFEPGFRPGGVPPVPVITAEQRNQFFDAAIGRRVDRVQDIQNLRGQISELRKIETLIQDRIKVTKDITRKLTLEDALVSVRRQERSVLQEIRDQTAQAKERQQALIEQRKALERERKELAQQRRERAADARTRRQFLALGLAADGSERVAGVGALRRRLGTLRDQVKGTALDTTKTRSQFARIAKVLAEGPKKVGRDVRTAIQQMFAEINDALNKGAEKKVPLTKFRVVSADEILSGFGLSPDQLRIARARLAKVGAGGAMTSGGIGAFGAPVAGATGGGMFINGPITVVANDPNELMRKLQRTARKRATQTTGPTAGNSTGIVR